MKTYSNRSGFTLVEVLVASLIAAFVALVAVGTLRAVSSSAEMVDNNISAAAEVRFAASVISRDLMNFYRTDNFDETMFLGTVEELPETMASCMVFYAVGRTKARFDQPEGDVYEVEYYLRKDEKGSALMRRLWPYPDKDIEPGGVLTVIAENIDIFDVRYFDGEQWEMEWPEEMTSWPELVEVTIAAGDPGRQDSAMESFIVNFARFARDSSGRSQEDSDRGGDNQEGNSNQGR